MDVGGELGVGVAGDGHGGCKGGECVFNDEAVFVGDEENTDSGFVAVASQLPFDGGDVEAELADLGGRERLGLELEDDVPVQVGVVEEQVQEEFVAADLESVLAAHVSEASSEVLEELSDLLDQCGLEVTFTGAGFEVDEVEAVGVSGEPIEHGLSG